MSQIKTVFSIEGSDFILAISKEKGLLLENDSNSSQTALIKYYKQKVKNNVDLSNKKIYVYPENNITKNHWDSIKNLDVFKRTLKTEDADYKLLSFKAFNKSLLPQWRGIITNHTFIEELEKNKEHLFYKFSLLSTLASGHQEMLIKKLNNYVEELKKILSEEDCYVYKNSFYVRSVDHNDYTDWDFRKLYAYFCKALLQMCLQNAESEDYYLYLIKSNRINTIEEFMNSSNYIDEEIIFKVATKDLAIIDRDMYNSISQMLRSSDKGNKELAISIMLNVDFDKSFGYLCLIMYENISQFSSNRDWFSSSAAKSFLTRFNSTAEELLKSTTKYHDFKGASLAKSIEGPSTFVALLKESGHNTSDILEIVKEIMLKDFKNFINSSWMNKIINQEQLFQAFDFSNDVKEHKGE